MLIYIYKLSATSIINVPNILGGITCKVQVLTSKYCSDEKRPKHTPKSDIYWRKALSFDWYEVCSSWKRSSSNLFMDEFWRSWKVYLINIEFDRTKPIDGKFLFSSSALTSKLMMQKFLGNVIWKTGERFCSFPPRFFWLCMIAKKPTHFPHLI